MSYYFVIVGTRDNPLYQADLVSKPAGSSGPVSFFSSSASSSAAQSAHTEAPGAPTAEGTSSTSGTSGGVFGFGNALGAIAGGLGAARDTGRGNLGALHNTASGEGKGLGFGRYNDKHVLQMIAHSSLDVVEDKQFMGQNMYLKAVDRMNEWTTSAFVAPGNLKFLILHEHKHDDGIRNFFYDVWEMVVKITMNPFHDLNDPIDSPSFDAKVRASARKHL